MDLSSVKSFWDDSGAEAHIAFQLCDIQGRLFVRSARKGWDSEKFVSFFMKSRVAEGLDSVYNRMQWAGEEYLLDETVHESGGSISPSASPLSEDILYWIGYIYRYWHYYKDEKSRDIYRTADYTVMKNSYLMFHTLSPELAIDDLIEMAEQRKRKRR